MSASPPSRAKLTAWLLLLASAFLLPPFVFLGWILWSAETLGNDYPAYQLMEPAYLRFMTAQGLEPMWYPHLTGGIPIGGLFFAQYFHAPAWITSHLPGFWSGEALRLVGVRHLLLLAAGHALFHASFRRGVGLGTWPSYLLSFACVYHLRNLDALRYGAGIEGTLYAQAVVLLALLHVLGPSRPSLVLLVPVSQLLFTCGYPVVIPFVALTAVLSIPVLGGIVGPRVLFVRGLQTLGAALVGFLLAAPNWMAFTEWLSVNYSRAERPTLEWAASLAVTGGGLFDNLFLPWRAEVHSAFGGSALLMLVLGTVAVALARRARGAWPLLLLLAFPFVYALGRATPLFPLFFTHVPGFASLRAPGRAFVMLPLLLVLAFLWLRARGAGGPLTTELRIAGVTGMLVGLGVAARLVLGGPMENPPEYSAQALGTFWTPGHQLLWLAAGLLVALGALWAESSRIALAVVVAASAAQTGMLLRHGTWTLPRPASASFEDLERVSHLPLYGRHPLLVSNDLREDAEATATSSYSGFLRSAGDRGNCFLPIQPVPRLKGMLLPFYLSDRVACAADRDAALRLLREGCRPHLPAGTVVLEAPCRPYGAPQEPQASRNLLRLNERNRVVALTPNLITLEVDTHVPSILVTAFPDATRNWSGVVDGEPAPLIRVDGSLLGLHVPEGRHRVSVRYFSRRIVMGHRVAFATAVALAALGLLRLAGACAPKGRARTALSLGLLTAFLAVCLPAYSRWEQGFLANARREVLLSNDYAAILAKQVARWERLLAGTAER